MPRHYEYELNGKSKRKRSRSEYAEEESDDEEYDDSEEEEDDEDDDDYNGGEQNKGSKKKKKKAAGHPFLDLEVEVTDDEEEDDENNSDDDGFIDTGPEIPEDDGIRSHHRRPLLPREDEDLSPEEYERMLEERYGRNQNIDEDYHEEAIDQVDQQALLPSVRDPKLWMVKCAIGREREVAACLMQKCIDKESELQIRSVIALDHLKNYIYIEAEKEAHVREAVKGMHTIFPSKILLVPIKEMTDVLSVKSKAIDISRDTWVRMKNGLYKGDLAQVVDIDNVRQRATVKLIPRVDLEALVNKLEGRDVPKKKAFTPPARKMNIDEFRELGIRAVRKKDPYTGEHFEKIGGMLFKDGFLYKSVSLRSLSTQHIQPSVDELNKFSGSAETGGGYMSSLKALFANRKKGHFMKGDRVIVDKGDIRNMKGSVVKVEDDTVHIKPNDEGLPIIAMNDEDLCKYFEPGNKIKVVSGATEGATGMVVSVEGHVVNIVSDTTKELLRVFADSVMESSEVASGMTRIGDYELRDLVLLDDNSFGVIIRVESEGFQVLRGVPERPDVALVRLRDIKCKIDQKRSHPAEDHYKNRLSVKDVVRILEGPCKGKQGPIEHIYKGILYIYDRHHLEHANFICVKPDFCILVGGSWANGDRNGNMMTSRFAHLKTPPRAPQSPMRSATSASMNFGRRQGGGRGTGSLIGTTIKIRLGHYKGCKGRVVDIKGSMVRVELESQMKVVSVDRSYISDNVNVSTPLKETSRYGMGSETPMHPSRTPLHPYMTPMRDSGATPIHDGMRTPMRDRAWNPYTPMSPPRDNWEDGNPASWGTSQQYPRGSTPSRAYEAPTPSSGTPMDSANVPSPYLPSTPGGQPPVTPSSAYLPGTPGGIGDLDTMSPVLGGNHEGPLLLPDILVSVRRACEGTTFGVIREVLQDGSCRVALGSTGNGEVVPSVSNEIEVVPPRKAERIKIMGGANHGVTGKLIGIDGTDGIVKIDDTLDVKILDMAMLAKLVQT